VSGLANPPLPNAEDLVSSFFRHDLIVLATELGDRTYTEVPKADRVFPLCRVTRVGGGAENVHAIMDDPLIQVDVWGGPKKTAQRVAQVLRGALADRLPFRNDEGCLMCVLRWGGLRYLPDTTEDPARPRYLFDVTLRTRP
jgi:hypothetical protein